MSADNMQVSSEVERGSMDWIDRGHRPEQAATVRDRSVRPAAIPTPSASKPWTSWLVAAMVATLVLYGIDIVFHPLTATTSIVFQKFASSFGFFGAAVLCAVKGRESKGERSAWWLLAAAMALWGVASVFYFVFLVVVPVADPLWLAGYLPWLTGYLPAYLALYKLLRKRAHSAGRAVWIDALVGGLGVGGVGAALVFQSVLQSSHAAGLAAAIQLAFPFADLGLLALLVAAITVTGWRATGLWHWIAPAFAIFAIADSIYLVEVANGTYMIGGLVDLGWPAAATLVGLAAWRPEPPVSSSLQTNRGTAIVVPTVVGLAALTLLVTEPLIHTNPVALSLATASIFGVLIRFYLTARDNARLLEQTHREATTDALTGLANRRQLMADLSAHRDGPDPQPPLMLTLFDLDGFKEYNDTFGHVAGDQLLARLGGRLRSLRAGHGNAYRLGGDEFCTLWKADDHEVSPATMAQVASRALSEHGEAFSVGCSYGSVLLPSEATAPSEALRIADRRMYSYKRSGRSSAGRQSSDVLLRTIVESDSELGIHMGAVADLAVATAVRLSVPREDLEAVRQTALLHDVGKLAIPDEILRKPAALDEAEWAFIKRHTLIGERIISAAPALAGVAKLVRSTHERHDGTGYPDGLAGADIPLIARIIAVCDAYDAMVTERAYRSARDIPAAIAELRLCAGAQFDSAVVEAFVRTLATGADPVQMRDADLQGAGHMDQLVGAGA